MIARWVVVVGATLLGAIWGPLPGYADSRLTYLAVRSTDLPAGYRVFSVSTLRQVLMTDFSLSPDTKPVGYQVGYEVMFERTSNDAVSTAIVRFNTAANARKFFHVASESLTVEFTTSVCGSNPAACNHALRVHVGQESLGFVGGGTEYGANAWFLRGRYAVWVNVDAASGRSVSGLVRALSARVDGRVKGSG